jgi:hypothetical protein
MKHNLFRKSIAFGIVVVLLVTTIGISNVPGINVKTENEQTQEMIKDQNEILVEENEFPDEEYSQIQITGTTAKVSAYMRDGRR